MIYRAVLLFLQKYLWSTFIKRQFKAKIFTIMVLGCALFVLSAFVASLIYTMSFEQGLWLIWSYVSEWGDGLSQMLWSKGIG